MIGSTGATAEAQTNRQAGGRWLAYRPATTLVCAILRFISSSGYRLFKTNRSPELTVFSQGSSTAASNRIPRGD